MHVHLTPLIAKKAARRGSFARLEELDLCFARERRISIRIGKAKRSAFGCLLSLPH
jgi:hypothetical protein